MTKRITILMGFLLCAGTLLIGIGCGDAGSGDVCEEQCELTFACDALCDALDSCPTIRALDDCVAECVDGYRVAENGSADCSSAVIDMIDCQSAMSCSEKENRILGLSARDSCTEADEQAVTACLL